MRLGLKYLLMTVLIVLALSISLEGISLSLFSHKIHDLTRDLYAEKIDRLVELAFRQDELFFEGVYKDEASGPLRVIDSIRIDYRTFKDPLSYVFIVDLNGRAVLHPAETRWESVFKYRVEKGEPIFNDAVVAMMRAKKQGEYTYSWHGETKWCVFKVYEPWGWIFCQTTSVEKRDSVVMAFLLASMGAAFFVILLGVLLTLWLSQKFIHPVNLIIGRLQKIARGELTFTPNQVKRISDDEIEMLDQAVNKMAEDLSKVTVSRDHVDNILNAAAEGIMGLNLKSEHTFVNASAARMLGYTADELVGRPSHLLWHHTRVDGTAYPPDECPILSSITLGMVHQRDNDVFWRKDGTCFPVEYASTPVMRNGEITGVVVTFSDITERKRAEEALQESEKRFMDVLYASQDAILLISGDLFIDCNETTARMLGYSGRNEFLMTHPSKLSPSFQLDGRDSFEKANDMMRIAREKGFHRFEWTHRKASGEDFPVEVSLTPILLKGKTVLHCVWRDMTERKRVDEALQDSETKYRMLVEMTGNGYLILDAQGKVVDANREYVRLSGHRTLTDILGRSVIEWTSPEFKEQNAEAIAYCEKHGFIRDFTTEYFDRNGRVVPVEVNATVEGEGAMLRIVALCRDITERKKAAEKLERAASEWRRTFDSISDFVFLMDMDARIVRVNKALFEAFGVAPGDLIGKKCHDVMHKLGNFCPGCSFKSFLTDGKARTQEVEGLNGMPLLVTVSPVFDDGGKLIGAVHIAKDMTEIRRTTRELDKTSEQLQTAQARLVQSEKMASIGQLAAGVAHEINNPAGFVASNLEVLETYISGYLRMIALMNKLTGAVARGQGSEVAAVIAEIKCFEETANFGYIIKDSENLLKQSRDGISRIEKIVSDLKTFAHEDIQWLDESTKIEDVLELALGIAQNELKYRVDLRKDYGETPPVRCNVQKMGQVFLNLLVNAAQAIPDKGSIAVQTYFKGGFVCVDISDTGCGISKENLKKIFDPFFTTKPAGKGTGLGLSISYELVKKQGGEIVVRSVVGEGTTFTVMLPLTPVQECVQTQEAFG